MVCASCRASKHTVIQVPEGPLCAVLFVLGARFAMLFFSTLELALLA